MSIDDWAEKGREFVQTCDATHPATGERCMRLAGHVDYAPPHWPSTEGREWLDDMNGVGQ